MHPKHKPKNTEDEALDRGSHAVDGSLALESDEPKQALVNREQRRSRRKRAVRARTISVKRMTKRELELGRLLYPDVEGIERPRTRADCVDGPRPCPFVACRHHLYMDVSARTGAIKINFPDLDVWDMSETCALDVADRGGTTLEEVGAIMNLTRERIRQVEVKGNAKLTALRDMMALRDYVDEGPMGKRRLPVLEDYEDGDFEEDDCVADGAALEGNEKADLARTILQTYERTFVLDDAFRGRLLAIADDLSSAPSEHDSGHVRNFREDPWFTTATSVIEPGRRILLACENTFAMDDGMFSKLRAHTDGLTLEAQVMTWLRELGVDDVTGTPRTGDQGADMIFTHNGRRVAVLCKHHKDKINNKAVQEVHAARSVYGCTEAWVVTNGVAAPGSQEAAQATGVRMVEQASTRERIEEALRAMSRA
jgi:hypothetical protein